VVTSGVLGVLAGDPGLPRAVGTVLLWLLCGIGWIYFLAIVRLRQAWHDSARTMNQIKDFCIEHVQEFEPATLRSAFRWRSETLPRPGKRWTVFHYSVLLIALMDSVAYVAGGILLHWEMPSLALLVVTGYLTMLGLAFFALHAWLYAAFLKQDRPARAAEAKAAHS
jgi:hypothetical protein